MRRVSSTLIPRTKRIFPREYPLFLFPFLVPFSCSLPHTHPAAPHTSRKPLGLAPRYHLSPSPSGSILGGSIPLTPLNPLRTAFPGSKSVILIPRALPAGLPGSRSPFLIHCALSAGLPGSILGFSIPSASLRPLLKALPGSRSPFLIHCALSAGLPGSILGFSIPFAPLRPLLKPLSGSKPAFLSPQTLSGAACSCCRSGAGEAYTGAPPQTPAPLKPFPTLLRKVTGRGGPHPRTCSIIYSL